MTLHTSGLMSTDHILAELRNANPGRNYPLSLTDPDVLALAGKSGPPVSMPGDFYGKSAVPQFSISARNDSNSAQTQFGAGTFGCAPGVNVFGGVGAKSYAWTVLSNPRGLTVSLNNSATVTVSYSYRQNEMGSGTVILRCTVSDSTGAQRTVDVTADLIWQGNA